MLRIFFCINSLFFSLNLLITTHVEGATYKQIIPVSHNWFIINELSKNPLYNSPKTVFLVNLYNNILQSGQFLNSPEWILERKEYLQKHCDNVQEALSKEIEALEYYLSYQPLNPLIPRVISEVATNSNCLIFGLAERSPCSIPHTLSLLENNNLTFSDRIRFVKHSLSKISQQASSYIVFTEGVIFSNFNDLATVCKTFLQQQQLYIETLIYLDSSIANLNTIQNYCENNNINFLGLLNNENINTYAEQRKAASILMQGITKLLSDKAAARSLLILFQNTLTK